MSIQTCMSIRPSGIRSRITRRLAIWSLRARIAWAEEDLDAMVAEQANLPPRIRRLDLDLQELRVQLAIEEQS